MIYFDSAASYPMLPEVKIVLLDSFSNLYANSASSHFLGESALNKVDQVRLQIADLIGAYPSEIVFTSGATESNNIALKSILLGKREHPEKKHLIISAVEHKCVFAICDYLRNIGFSISVASPNEKGLVDPASIKKLIRDDTALVSVMHANNELGTINQIREIGNICLENQVLFHSDAAQSLSKVDIDVDEMNVDIMSFSAHKIGGPKGIGAVYIRNLRHKQILPVIHGAGQEQGIRGGTVAAPLVLGFGEALSRFPEYYNTLKEKHLNRYLISKLIEVDVSFNVNGDDLALPHIISITLPKTNASLLVRDNERFLCLAQGSACSSKEIEASHVLTALGMSRSDASSTFRISFTHETSFEEIDDLVAAIKRATK